MFISASREVPLGSFVVARVKPCSVGEKMLGAGDIVEVYHGKNDRADLLMGWGVAKHISHRYGLVLIVFNPNENIILPKNTDDAEG
jgi:hypothetical protein